MKIEIIDLTDYTVRFELTSGSVSTNSCNTALTIIVRKVSEELYKKLYKVKNTNNSRISNEKGIRKYHIKASTGVAKIEGYIGGAEYKNTVGILHEYHLTIYGKNLELLVGETALRKYIIDETIADVNSRENTERERA